MRLLSKSQRRGCTVVVCDRESFRIQVFDLEGNFVNWAFSMRPAAICHDAAGNFFVAQNTAGFAWTPNIGQRIVVYGELQPTMEELTSMGREDGAPLSPKPSGPFAQTCQCLPRLPRACCATRSAALPCLALLAQNPFVRAEYGVDEPDTFVALHAVAADSMGDLYAAEVSWVNPEAGGSSMDPPREMRSLHKYRRVSG